MKIMTAIKSGLKKLSQKRIAEAKLAPAAPRGPSPTEAKGAIGSQQLRIEEAKFSHPETKPESQRVMLQELPFQYEVDRIVLQVRDPRWLHAYWEISSATIESLKQELKDGFYQARRILRVYDVTSINFDGNNAHRFFDVYINDYGNNWYLDTNVPGGRSWCVDFGLLLPSGKFKVILRSNIVHTPLEGPSWITDEEWMVPEDMFARLYGMGFGLGRSSPIGRAWQENFKHALFSGMLSSPVTSPVKIIAAGKNFWLKVDCDLIVYGATEPDAKLTIQGKAISLRQDGTFSLRFSFPDGKQVIPLKALSADNSQERMISLTVNRDTK
jgi:hypothetical protein